MEWNNGTIFRVFVNSGNETTINCKVDIAQQELNNTVFMGIENFVLHPNVGADDYAPSVNETLQDFWAQTTYLQLASVQLPPYIDYTSQNAGTAEENHLQSHNTSVFARLPLIASPTLGAADQTTIATFARDHVLNKDSILYEMRNNPHALSSGRLQIRLLDQDGNDLSDFPALPPAGEELRQDTVIHAFSFTLVIYKPSNMYN